MKSGSPVIVRKTNPAKTDRNILQVEFCQIIEEAITDQRTLLNLLMKGHKSFGPTERTRIAYQNMYVDAYKNFNLDIGVAFPTQFGAEIVIHEFCEGDEIPLGIRGFYENAVVFKPKSWLSYVAGEVITCCQQPKKTPSTDNRESIILTRNGSPIYRNTFFTVNTMDQTDYLIKHDNLHTGGFTSNSNKQASTFSMMQVGKPIDA